MHDTTGKDTNKSKLHAWRNSEQFKFRECLLLFREGYYLSSRWLSENMKIKIYRIIILSVVSCVWNLVAHFKEIFSAQRFGGQGTEEHVWAFEGGTNRMLNVVSGNRNHLNGGNASVRLECIVVHVTVNGIKILSVAQQCSYGELILLATIKRL